MNNQKKNYVNSKELEQWWAGWNLTSCDYSWEKLSEMIYKICQGVATKFNPKSEDEHIEHTHDAFIITLEKIKDGRLKFIRGKAPVFNLLTTAIIRQLCSKMNKEKRHKKHHAKYTFQFVSENYPELLSNNLNEFQVQE